MQIGTGIILYAILWFMTLFVVMPLRLTTQGEAGDVTPGTPPGAPASFNLKRKLIVTSIAAAVVWAVVAAIIISGVLPVATFDVMDQTGG